MLGKKNIKSEQEGRSLESVSIKIFKGYQCYREILEEMICHANLVSKDQAEEEIWFLQYQPVYTGGTSFDTNDIIDLEGVPFFKTGRGGKITFHGPGQEVCYPILNMKQRSIGKVPDVRKFVFNIEEVVIQTLKEFNIKAYRRKGMIGVWTINHLKTSKSNIQVEEKIAAIGIRFSRGVSLHGFSININTDLDYFKRITPCGIKNFGVCSIKSLSLSPEEVTRNDIHEAIKKSFSSIFFLDFLK